jgi:hypothetical protein
MGGGRVFPLARKSKHGWRWSGVGVDALARKGKVEIAVKVMSWVPTGRGRSTLDISLGDMGDMGWLGIPTKK